MEIERILATIFAQIEQCFRRTEMATISITSHLVVIFFPLPIFHLNKIDISEMPMAMRLHNLKKKVRTMHVHFNNHSNQAVITTMCALNKVFFF